MSETQSSDSAELNDAASSVEAGGMEPDAPEASSAETGEASASEAGSPDPSEVSTPEASSAETGEASSAEAGNPETGEASSAEASSPAPSSSPESSSAAPSPEAAPSPAPTATRSRRKGFKNIPHGIAHIKSSFNNTIISISDLDGNVISWSSAGNVGFSGSRKSTPYAAQMAAETAGRKAMEHGMRRVDVHVSGPGSGRETALRSLQAIGLEVAGIKDVTPVPYNGCRQPKRRRV